MSSEEYASQNRTTSEDELIKTCNMLLRLGDFTGVQHIVKMNQLVSSKLHAELEKAGAIADVLHAAENPLPDGLLDLYGKIRVTPPGPVLLEDFKKLMNLLDHKHNSFPFCQEASVRASLAWSSLSSPTIKDGHNLETKGNVLGDINVGSSQIGDGSCGDITIGGLGEDDNKKEQKMGDLNCSSLPASEDLKVFQAMKENPLLPAPKRQAPHNQVRSEDTSLVPKKNVGPETDDENVVITDVDDEDKDEDKDEDEDEDGQEIMSMARTAKLCIVNGKRVKLIPILKKKQK